MVLDRKKVLVIIKKQFVPKLTKIGFIKTKDKLKRFRIREDLIDVLKIQVGKSPGSLYLHYFVNFVADPFVDIVSNNIVGGRLGSNRVDGEIWFAENESQLIQLLDLVWSSVENTAVPFFNSIDTIQIFSVEVKKIQSERRYPFTLALMYAVLRETESAKSLCEQIKQKLIIDDDFDFESEENDIKLLENLNILLTGIISNSIEAQIDNWRSRNLNKLGIPQRGRFG